MNMLQPLARAGATLAAALLLSSPAWAAGSATLKTGADTIRLSWQDARTARFDGAGMDSGYMLARDGKAYMVQTEGGVPQVIEAGSMMRGVAQAAGADSDAKAGRVESVQATGKKETVAGIAGEVYQFRVTDADGKTETREVVLTGDPLVAEMTAAYMGFSASMVGADMMRAFTDSLPAGKKGLLRVDDDLVVQSVSKDKPAADAFELPAEPVNFGDLMQQILRQAQQR